MNHLNYNHTLIRIACRCKLYLITNGRPHEDWSRWRIYSRHSGIHIQHAGNPQASAAILNSKIERLKKRHPTREYKLVVVHETRHVTDFEQ